MEEELQQALEQERRKAREAPPRHPLPAGLARCAESRVLQGDD